MRSVALFPFFALLPVVASAAELTATSKVDAVTVFLKGAEVTRLAKVKIDKGEHTITIVDVPPAAVPGSIRVEGNATGKLEIASVDTRRTYLARSDVDALNQERRKVEDEIESLRDQKAAVDAQAHAAETQKTLIANLAQLPTRAAPAVGQAQGEDWQRVLALISQGSADASKTLIEAQIKAREFDRKIDDLENRLATAAPAKTEQTEVKVHVATASPLEADLTVRYQVADAGWTPLYDARLLSGSKTAPASFELARRAAITQRSGEDWDNVTLQLSTAQPAAGAAAPELEQVTVDYEREVKPQPSPRARMEDRTLAGGDAHDAAVTGAAPPAPALPVEPATQAASETAAAITAATFEATYAVPGRVTVTGAGETKRVMLTTEQLEPLLSCRAVPRIDAMAYLYAKLTLPKNATPLLPGQVYLFRDGTFVGTGSIPLLSPGEEHDLGFGVDDQVKVHHVAEEKRGETGLISSAQTETRNYRVSVKNMHERAINLVLLDQVPVSLQQDIKVEFTGKAQPSKAAAKDKPGIIRFDGKLEPDEEKLFEYGYRITWPTGRTIVYGP